MTTSSSTESIAQSVAKAGVVGTVKVSWTAVTQYCCKALSCLNILHPITDMESTDHTVQKYSVMTNVAAALYHSSDAYTVYKYRDLGE